MLSQDRLSSVPFVRHTQGGGNFRQYSFAILYLSHPLNAVQTFNIILYYTPLRQHKHNTITYSRK